MVERVLSFDLKQANACPLIIPSSESSESIKKVAGQTTSDQLLVINSVHLAKCY